MKGLTDYQKYMVIRPLPKDWPADDKGVPYLKRDDFSCVDWDEIQFVSFTNRKTVKKPNGVILLMFHYDYLLERIYSNPLKYIRGFANFSAVASLDFSAYRDMALWKIEENVRRSLWFGSIMQSYGIRVIPTITWAGEDSYEICFSHIPEGSVVAISTVGVSGEEEAFLRGFFEMKKKIKPSLIIVRGRRIRGMTGRFVFVSFEETFNVPKSKQIPLFKLSRVEDIMEGGCF